MDVVHIVNRDPRPTTGLPIYVKHRGFLYITKRIRHFRIDSKIENILSWEPPEASIHLVQVPDLTKNIEDKDEPELLLFRHLTQSYRQMSPFGHEIQS